MSLLNFVSRYRVVVVGSTPTSHLLPNSSFRWVSTISKSSFTVDYLINSCGLSPEFALKASKHVQLKSSTRPDSVLSLLKTFGISKPHISKLIIIYPRLLLANPIKTLKPKLEFFSSIGISGPIIGKFIHRRITSSLGNSINFLKRIAHTDTNVVKILSRFKWVSSDVERKMNPNISFLRNHGVPECYISKLLCGNPVNLLIKPDQFNKVVLELEKMGVTNSNNMFPHCLQVRLSMKKPTWDAKLAVYKSLGWSEDEVLSMFKRQPRTMSMSEKKVKLAINFLTNNLKWTRADIARNPTVLMLSLEKRVIPRTYVLQTLQSKSLINGISIGAALKDTEDVFLKKFVIKYCPVVPNLLKLYQSKMSTQSSLVGSATKCAIEKM